MKRLIICLFIATLFFIHCESVFSPLMNLKFFHPRMLSFLSLDDINLFWCGDTITHISNYVTQNFNVHPGFLNAVRYSADKKVIAVSVFTSQGIAIDAMEKRIDAVSVKIFPGVSYEKIKARWWWDIGLGRAIYINMWNTIVEVAYLDYDYHSETAKLLVEDVAIEAAKRVDWLSEPIPPEMKTFPWYINSY